MTKEELEKIFKDVEDGKKDIVRSMFDDFIFEHEQIQELKNAMKEIGVPKNRTIADKMKYLSKEYSNLSQRHDSKIKIFLSALGKYDTNEDSPLLEALRSFE